MQDGQPTGWKRRDFMGAAALVALALGLPTAAVAFTELDEKDAPTSHQRTLMKEVSQLVIPRSATPGAGEVGAGDFAILVLAHGLENSRKPVKDTAAYARFLRNDGSVRHVAWLERELDLRAGGDFLGADATRRAALLGALDAEAFASRASESPWKAIKALIVTGYYTSEPGGSEELRYEPVPGRFDPDLPLKPGDRAISNDWTAVDFG
ncbi:gluconate 2-dehydrogenase subunit 3 family protein [Novosphingobium sp. ERN07]|nr:gluconate 2-dehydrogenase subunit 3 family protein [Novosphingobium sp. ERN07]